MENTQVQKQSTFKLFKVSSQIIWYYTKKSKWMILTVLLSSMLSAGLMLYTIYLMGTFLSDIFVQLIADPTVAGFKNQDVLMTFIMTMSLFFGSYILQMLFSVLQSRLLVKISQNLGYNIRFDLFNKLQNLSIKYLDTQSTGNLMSCFTNDVDIVIVTFSQAITQSISALFTLVGAIIMVFLINPILATVSIVLAVLLFFFVGFFIKKSQPHFLRQQQLIGEVSSDIEEYNFAHKMSTLYGYQDEVISNFSKKIDSLKHASTKAQIISGIIFPYNNFINNIIITIVTTIIILFISFIPDLMNVTAFNFTGFAVASLYLMLLRQATSQISTIFSQLNQFQLAFAALSRIKNVLDVPNESKLGKSKKIKVTKGEISFNHVSFSYIEGKRVLNNINFVAKPNTMNAIVGPTGSGKTTIISLLSAYYDLDDGNILIDGSDINQFSKHSVREYISVVLQDSFLFDDTIMENIRYGRLKSSDEDVFKAAKLSNAHKFISKLPNGYNTQVSNASELLSEGEKQLISIARAFIANTKIIVLDEATSYVDTKTEKDIQAGMRKLMKNKTSIVIAHRLSTIKDADNIVVIKDGNQIESGNHETLMKNKQFYYKLNTAMDQDFDDPKDN